MNTCKDCFYWYPLGTMSAGSCHSDKFVYLPDCDTLPADGLAYWDNDGDGAEFETGPDFGCIHWQARPVLDA